MNPDASLAISRLTPDSERSSAPRPPTARRQPVEHFIHGDRRVDDYVWLRDKHNPEVIAHLNAENAYTDAILRDTAPFQEKLYQEMLGRILQTDLSVPYRLRGYLYFTRTEEGKQYLMHLRRRDTENAPEELLLDLNALAAGHSFLSLGAFAVSDDNSLLAYSLDTTGFRQYTLQIKNLTTGETLPVRIERVTSAAWAADNRTLFYTVEDGARRDEGLVLKAEVAGDEFGIGAEGGVVDRLAECNSLRGRERIACGISCDLSQRQDTQIGKAPFAFV